MSLSPASLEAGIHLVHKPVGATSFSVVQRYLALRDERPKSARRLPICHGGTLDPFAEGLLLILVGPAVQLFEHLHPIPKTYVAEIRWGVETDTGDAGGQVTLRGDTSGLTPEKLEQALRSFLGWTEQVPPSTSAKKVQGEPAYKKVHRGELVTLPASRVYLHEARFTGHTLPERSTLLLTCRGGFYVRALARDLGRALGCGAHLLALRRTAIGPWSDPEPAAEVHLVKGPALLPWLPARPLTDAEVGLLRKGGVLGLGPVERPTQELDTGFPAPPPLVRGFHQGRLSWLLTATPEGLKPLVELGRGT
jgi:tRNA pseudouridine55 synthase